MNFKVALVRGRCDLCSLQCGVGPHACKFASLQQRRAKAQIWNVREVSALAVVRKVFTREFCCCLPRMLWVAGWMRQPSVDDRLEQLVGLFNTRFLGEGPRLQYTRTRMPVSGKLLCTSVHSDSRADHLKLCSFLEVRVSWEDNERTAKSDVVALIDFLRGALVWSRVAGWGLTVDMLKCKCRPCPRAESCR